VIKKLTPEGRFESGIDSLVEGKEWAFVAVLGQDHPAALGCAVRGERGYYPIPEAWCHGDDLAEMQLHADELNREAGMDERQAAALIATTFAR